MGKIYCIMGKSSCGKDTLYQRLKEDQELALKAIVPYTTRPKRVGEEDGREYFFCDEKKVAQLEQEKKIIEIRTYHTVEGIWKYFTVDDGQINLSQDNYLMIGTLETFCKIKEYYGEAKVIPIYIEVEDGERLHRAIERERLQEKPKYEELCRRFLADTKDFSLEKQQMAGITRRFVNHEIEETLQEIKESIQQEME